MGLEYCRSRKRTPTGGGKHIHREDRMKKRIILAVLGAMVVLAVPIAVFAGGGFDQFGYNYDARIFVGPADGVDRILDGKVWGDPTYANDHLVMKWSRAWDDARFNGAPWTCDAWENNEWNGAAPGGSGEVWHYKIVWVGPELEDSPCWRPGGYPVWGEFEVIMDHGTTADAEHVWYAHGEPSGY